MAIILSCAGCRGGISSSLVAGFTQLDGDEQRLMKYDWERAIYRSVMSLDGEADLQDIYNKLPDFIELTGLHLKITWDRPAYHHIVRSYITPMCRKGLLRRVARGRYMAEY